LLDVMMPEMDGYEVLARLRAQARTCELPVIFVTALGTEADEDQGLALGAQDYVVKPIKPNVLMARVRTHVELKRAHDRLREQNQWLESEVGRRTRETLIAQDLTLATLAELAETRDNETGHHIQRTQAYVEVLARALQSDPNFSAELDEPQLQRIVKAAPLHDIGKIGIPDRILLKPGALTDEEFEVMKTHACIGGDALAHAISKAATAHQDDMGNAPGSEPPEAIRFLQVAELIARHHHERWDGSGYPDQLAGRQIPLPARLMALADVFDALTMRRIYKHAWTPEQAIAHIAAEAGRHFDPDIVTVFLTMRPSIADIARRLAD
jgi:putative two-component system response regulator